MILESLVTTRDLAGRVNIAPMGPHVNASLTSITLKPFRSSTTFANLRETSSAVVHVTDDVALLAAAAIGNLDSDGLVETVLGRWSKLVDCCRWFALSVTRWNDDPQLGTNPRPEASCEIVHRGEQRPMFGLSRAKHAVVEAAILATRIDMIGRDEVRAQMEPLRILIDKTGGVDERRALDSLEAFLHG